jgi:hypothetical protein
MANKKERIKMNQSIFKSEVLPEMIEKYKVVVYPSFYKFEVNGCVYDYYPGGGRLNKLSPVNYKLNEWSDMSITEFKSVFLNHKLGIDLWT